jgi:hypothetical protein
MIKNMYSPKLTRKIFQTGKYSYALTLPKDLIRMLGWQNGQLLEIMPDLGKKKLVVKIYKF